MAQAFLTRDIFVCRIFDAQVPPEFSPAALFYLIV